MDCAVVKSDILHREESTGVEVRINRRRRGGRRRSEAGKNKNVQKKEEEEEITKSKEDLERRHDEIDKPHTQKNAQKILYNANKKEISRGRRAPGVNLHYSKYSSTPMLFEP